MLLQHPLRSVLLDSKARLFALCMHAVLLVCPQDRWKHAGKCPQQVAQSVCSTIRAQLADALDSKVRPVPRASSLQVFALLTWALFPCCWPSLCVFG